MSTINYLRIAELRGVAPEVRTTKKRRFRGIPSDATIQREMLNARYESNVCPKCFTARSLTGDCAC